MSTVYSYRLKHDQNDRIVEKVETIKGNSMRWTYTYDKKGRLFEAHLDNRLVCQCHYDKQGRRMQDYFPRTHGSQVRNYQYRMDNRLQQAGNNGYTHDKQGFRSIWNSGGKYTLYEYAPDYRLLNATKEDDGIIFEFSHDDNGQREMKYRNGELVEAYIWLDFVRMAGFHDGETGYRFAYNHNERTPYAMQREDEAVAYLYYDQVGSLRVVADQSGNVIKEVLYDPFGGIIEDTNPDLRIPIGFAGGLHDRDLGFVRFGWRDYDTFTSRWTAPDPMGDAGGDPDWYGYCLDDPVNWIDPLGLGRDPDDDGYNDCPGVGTSSSSSSSDDGKDSLDGLSNIPSLQDKINRGEIGAGGVPSGSDDSGTNGRNPSQVSSLKTRANRKKTEVQKAHEMEAYAVEQNKKDRKVAWAKAQKEKQRRALALSLKAEEEETSWFVDQMRDLTDYLDVPEEQMEFNGVGKGHRW